MHFIRIEIVPRLMVICFFILGGVVEGWDRFYDTIVCIIFVCAFGSWITFGYMYYTFDHIPTLPTASSINDLVQRHPVFLGEVIPTCWFFSLPILAAVVFFTT